MRTIATLSGSYWLPIILVTLTLETSMSEFIDLQRLSNDERG
jgi:hypothetical protein